MIRTRSFALWFLAWLAFFYAAYALILSSAAHADPVADATTAVDASWSLVEQFGPLWGGMLLLLGVGQVLLRANASTHWIAQGRTLAVISGSLGVLGALAQWRFGGAPLEGVLTTLVAAVAMVWHPAVPAPRSARDPQAGRSRTSLLLTLAATALVAVSAVALLGCTPGQRAGAGQRVAAGLVAALDCEAAGLDGDLLADATQLAGATVQRWFGDQSSPDDEARAQIKADLTPLKSNLARCAIAGAVAAIVHRPAQPQGIIASALSAPGQDPELVRLEIQAAARELGWAPVVVGGEVL